MAAIRVTVSIDDDHLATLDEVVDRLRERGLTVDRVLTSLGIVTGSVDDIDTLRDVPGVLTVDPEGRKGVPPPDQDIQ